MAAGRPGGSVPGEWLYSELSDLARGNIIASVSVKASKEAIAGNDGWQVKRNSNFLGTWSKGRI